MGTLLVGGRPCVTTADDSVYQGHPDYRTASQVLDGRTGKGSEGATITDPVYRANRDAWRSVTPKPHSSYVWIRHGVPGRDQVRRWLDATNGLEGVTLVPALDVEEQGLTARTVEEVIQALYDERLARWLGPTGEWVPCRIYTGSWFRLADMPTVAKPAGWSAFDLWIAAYPRYDWVNPDPRQLTLPTMTGPWPSWSAWQYAGGNGRCPGYSGAVDRSVETVESFVRSTNPGGQGNMPLSDDDKNDVRAIVREEVAAAEADQLGKLAGFEQDTRRYMGRQAILVQGDPAQYYLDSNGDGRPVKVHIPSPEVLATLQGAGYVDNLPPLVLPADDGNASTRWFKALPVVEG